MLPHRAKLQGHGIRWTDGKASEASDAGSRIHVIKTIIKRYVGRTYAQTCPALYTPVRMKVQLQPAHFVEKAVDGPNGTDCPAEGTGCKSTPDQEEYQ